MNPLLTLAATSSPSSGGAFAAVMGILAAVWLFALAVAVIMIIANWKIFTKAGREGWKCLIPIYNSWVLFEIAGLSGPLSLLLFIPFVNFIVMCYMYYKLALAFGKDTGFCIGLILLNPIFILILAFSKDITYQLGTNGAAPAANGAAPAAQPAQPSADDQWVNGQNQQ